MVTYVLIFFCISANAQTSIGIEDNAQINTFTGSTLAASNYNFIDYNAFGVQSTQTGKKIKNVISLRVKDETAAYLNQNFTASVHLKIEYGHNSSSLFVINDQVLSVTYTKGEGLKYNAQNYFSFDDAEYVKVTIQQFNPSVLTLGSVDIKTVLSVENEMRITRFFELPATVPSAIGLICSPSLPVASADDHVTVSFSWPSSIGGGSSTGNNATQLEWAWIENEAEDNYKVGGVINNDLVFKHSTRVDLPYKKLSYDIPLLYDGAGKLYYRIRAVNVKQEGGRSDGPWNLGSPVSFAGHNPDLNWQATTTFAEEGKRKSVVQYFDGTLRSRQTVTKDNSTNNAITSESFYDGQGRQAIQILPNPTINGILKYRENLNLFNGQVANQDPAEIFDLQPVGSPVSNSTTPGLSTASGTSQYYSPSNPNAAFGANKLIPDAQGYPYTYTRYTDDATGRVMSQSGVGDAFKMGSKHETKYYYGGASQEELDGLFGTEVGNFTHYSKNMVKDANGQMSISYTDMHNRTIATALAGDAPAALQPLNLTSGNYPGQSGALITRNLLDNNTNVATGNQIEAINYLLVPTPTFYTFRYELNPQTLQIDACPGATPAVLCYDCLYDLQIAITDESGETAPIIKNFSNVTLNPDDACNTATPAFTEAGGTTASNIINYTTPIALPIGSYSVRKTLSVSMASLQHYKELYMTKALCKTEQEIIDSVYNVLQTTSGCGTQPPLTCESCNTQLGTQADFRTAYLTNLGLNPATPQTTELENEIVAAYTQAQHNCNLLCNNVSQSLPTIREMMLADMVPYGGQYAVKEFDPTYLSHTMFDKYDIFAGMTGPAPQPFYKHPLNIDPITGLGTAGGLYLNEQGNIDVTIHPELTNSYVTLNATAPDDFELAFHQSWANALLPYHPEYKRLLFAEQILTPSFNWINTFTQTETCPTAGNPYFSPVTNDPFFGVTSTYTTAMNNAIANYRGMGVSMWQLAYGEVMCKNITNLGARQSCYTSAPNSASAVFFSSGFTSAQKDQAWQIFRGLYAELRNEYVNEYIADQRPLIGGTADETDLIAQGFHLWFPRSNQQQAAQAQWDWWPADINTAPGVPGGGATSAPNAYDNRCESYIARWKAQLLLCPQLAASSDKDAILLEITTRMKAVCINGSNPANPYGSSNVDPATPATVTDRSFEDVIKNVFLSHGLMNSNGTYINNYCNPFVIEWPKPFGKNPPLVAEVTTQIDSCNCKAYTAISNAATAAGYNPANFTSLNTYLQLHYQQTITQGIFDGLQHCSEMMQVTCGTRDTTYVYDCDSIPPTCGSAHEDTSCATTVHFLHMFNSASSGLQYQLEFTIGFNQHFGTTCTWAQLVALYYSCGMQLPDQVGMQSCNDLSNILQLYTYSAVPANVSCEQNFANFFNQQLGTTYTFEQINAIYLAICGNSLTVCGGQQTYTCSALHDLLEQFINGGIAQYGDCQQAFADAFNQNFGSSYMYQQIATIYLQTCSITLDPCNPYSCVVLNDLINNYPGPSENCGQDFTDYFNQHFSTNYTLAQIDSVYFSSCGVVLDICNTNQTICPAFARVILTFHQNNPTPPKNCPEAFTQLFNQLLGTAYNWEQIQAIYLLQCGEVLDVCSPYPCHDLQNLITAYPGPADNEDCQTAFANYFNKIYGTSYSWSDIAAIYQSSCGQMLDICSRKCQLTCSITYCDTLYTPYQLPHAEPLPDFLKCGYVYNDPCISCSGISAYTAQFKALFTPQANTAPIFTGTSLTPDQLLYNANYARFINYRTGFQFNWLDYSQAANTAGCNLDNYAYNSTALQNVICGSATPLTDPPVTTPVDPCEATHNMAIEIGQQIFNTRVEYYLQAFDAAYMNKCLVGVKDIEQFSVQYTNSEYHYTLYYYNQAGNLVKTVPPKAVHPNFSISFTNSTKTARNNGSYLTTAIRPPHVWALATNYRYNSLNGVTQQQTPDASQSSFWYDILGRLAVSQNAQQFVDNKWSYTLYDGLGRITEVGQKPHNANEMDQNICQSSASLDYWLNSDPDGGAKEQITGTIYDLPFAPLAGSPTFLTQLNLRNRVSYTYTKKLETDTYPAASTYYSYDVHGNVDKLLQDYYDVTKDLAGSSSRYKLITYDYDLISGKVNKVNYQPGFSDAFYHKYGYDAENRINDVSTSRDGILWQKDASYKYYAHGPLARTQLGQLGVQGLDYTYTIQGWIKGLNQTGLNAASDPGADGTISDGTAKDALSFTLHYFDETLGSNSFNDYTAIGGTSPFARPVTGNNLLSLYNGNIGAMTVNNYGLSKGNASTTNALPLFYRYKYDQLNRIISMDTYKGLNTSLNTWVPMAINDYKEAISYDPNGNILTYNRKGAPTAGMPLEMDDLSYDYQANSNKLKHVSDNPSYSSNYTATNNTEDINNQTNATNYTYDDVGNMITDYAEGITNITWSVYGKILSISKNGTITYDYDASGNRISKKVGDTRTIYVRDATGNVMSVYTSQTNSEPAISEINLYGNSRLGMQTQPSTFTSQLVLDGGFTLAQMSTFVRGEKVFELSNHLGNVLETVSDKKIQHSSDNINVDYTLADVMTANDYYPFGMQLPGRRFERYGIYRFSVNAQEKTNEINENLTSALYWEYDSRIGRRWNIDPVTKPFLSDYSTFGNNPVTLIDPDGADYYKDTEGKNKGDIVYMKGSGEHKGYTNITGKYTARDAGGFSYLYGHEKGDITQSGPTAELEVTVRAKIKHSLADASGLNVFNHHIQSQVWREDYWNYKFYGRKAGLSEATIRMYDNWIAADESYKKMSMGAVAIIASPFLLETGIVSATQGFLWKSGLDGVGQLIVNKGDASKIDVFDMALAGVSTPGASAVFGGAIDIKLNGEFSAVGFGKTWQNAVTDGVVKYAFGGKGLGGVPGNTLKKLTFSTPLTTLENNIWLRCMNVPISISGKVLRKELKNKTNL